MIHNNNSKDLIEHLNTKCAFSISYYQVCDVVLLNQLDFSALYHECSFRVNLGIIEIHNIATYKIPSNSTRSTDTNYDSLTQSHVLVYGHFQLILHTTFEN